jgi:uncharacterized membrane protein required for colicin V production
MHIQLPINWFDVVAILMLTMGLFRGRKRGMSVEVFTMLMWLAVVLVASAAYKPAGGWLDSQAHLGPLTCYIIAYLVIAAAVALMFALFRRATNKVAGTDTFGRGEYYLGMPAGVMLIAVLALVNARLYSYKEIKDQDAYLKDMYGSEYFPRLSTIQTDIFERSLIGPQIRNYLSFLLIKPTIPDAKPAANPGEISSLP